MNFFINQQQIDYILYHLRFHINLDNDILKLFVYLKSKEDISNYKNRIIFIQDAEPFSLSAVRYIDSIPVLFPDPEEERPFIVQNGNVVFTHDYLKSAFYLLSGYGEYKRNETDFLGRFPYSESVQAKLDIINKPVVNYYFETVINGILHFQTISGISAGRKNINDRPLFFVTHDVDRVKYFTIGSFLFSLKKVLLPSTGKDEKKKYFREFFRIGHNLIRIRKKNDPYWNFEYLSKREKDLGIRSTYFFLPKGRKNVDSDYRFNQTEISNLILFLRSQGNEIGLHGTADSSYSFSTLSDIHNEFVRTFGVEHAGIRQHRLMWRHPLTAINQDIIGFSYDSTLCYAAHEGFRNSYCHPFRLFDFENNKMLNHWEIPLLVMDGTLFGYRKLTFDDAESSVKDIFNEVEKFNGVFTILWHNSSLDDSILPGIDEFYFRLLSVIVKKNPEIVTGKNIADKYSSYAGK